MQTQRPQGGSVITTNRVNAQKSKIEESVSQLAKRQDEENDD